MNEEIDVMDLFQETSGLECKREQASKMKIKEITEEHILFDSGDEITCLHYQDCCEHNYADFEQLDDIARITEFDRDLKFEKIERSGFRFGNDDGRMFFVPCYSMQNGYYSSEIEICFNGKSVLDLECEVVIDDED